MTDQPESAPVRVQVTVTDQHGNSEKRDVVFTMRDGGDWYMHAVAMRRAEEQIEQANAPDQTESASEHAESLADLEAICAGMPNKTVQGIIYHAAAAIRALEAKVRDSAAVARALDATIDSRDALIDGLCAEAAELRADRDRLAGEVENLRMQVVACGMAAQSNTRETHDAFTCHEDYRSASLNDVLAAVAREILHREEVARLTAELAAARENEARYLLYCSWVTGPGPSNDVHLMLRNASTPSQVDAAFDAARRAGGEG